MAHPLSPHATSSAALALAATLFLPALAAAAASDAVLHYTIPAGPLDTTLLAVSRQSGQLIVFSPELLAGRRSEAQEGSFSLDQLLARLLQGHGLAYARDERGAIRIHRAPPLQAGAAARPAPDLPVVQVRADRLADAGLAARETPTTRTGIALQETPQSINVIGQDVLRAQNAQTLGDALRNVSGVQVTPGSLGAASLNVRGFTSGVLSDGMATPMGSTPLAMPAIALEAVEVLKGPSAILAGASSPGGLANAVQKIPQAQKAHEVRLGYGSGNERQLALDSTGALEPGGRLSYRLLLDSQRSSRSPGGYDGKKEFYVSPSLRWKDGATDLVVRYSRNVRTSPFSPYTLVYQGRPWRGSLPQPLGNREDRLSLRQSDFYYQLEQQLNANWQFVSKGSYNDVRFEQFGWYSGAELEDDSIAWLNTFAQGGDTRQQRYENYVRGNHAWGEVRLNTVAGAVVSRTRADSDRQAIFNDWVQASILEPLPPLPSARSAYQRSFSESTPVGAFWQQNLRYGKWGLSAGLRFDTSWEGLFRRASATEAQKRRVWSPSVGLLYAATPWLSVYGNHLKGYQPPSFVDRDGHLLPPQISQQAEAGLKFLLLDQRLSLTTSVYRIKFSNDAVFSEAQSAYVATPGYVNRGFEIDVQGRVTRRLELIAHYNNGRSGFSEDDLFHTALPRHQASLWARYHLPSPAPAGLSASLGLTYASTGYLDRDQRYRIPAQVQTDAGLAYQRGPYDFNLTVRNLFDKDLYVSSMDGDTTFVPLQQPRKFLLTASYSF